MFQPNYKVSWKNTYGDTLISLMEQLKWPHKKSWNKLISILLGRNPKNFKFRMNKNNKINSKRRRRKKKMS